jgi:hypothetical protein
MGALVRRAARGVHAYWRGAALARCELDCTSARRGAHSSWRGARSTISSGRRGAARRASAKQENPYGAALGALPSNPLVAKKKQFFWAQFAKVCKNN